MTLIVTVNGRESIWMLADRRLSYRRKPPKDDGRKIMFLDTSDGCAILGYAGLGATASGIEPSDWMSAVLRGNNLTMEQSLGEIAKAMQEQLPKHLSGTQRDALARHITLIPCFVDGEVRLYSIGLLMSTDQLTYSPRFARHFQNPSADRTPRTPRIMFTGSGEICLLRNKLWIRDLLHLVNASDSNKVSPLIVADELAKINEMVHRNTADGTVGPHCIVAWRHNKLGVHKGGGDHQFYEGTQRTDDSSIFASIAVGLDIQAMAKAAWPHLMAQLSSLQTGEPEIELDVEKINADIAKIPQHPDKNLK
jgi:hypothetical protein